MHKNKYCHRDVKLANIVCFTETIKLIDFGLSIKYTNAYGKYWLAGTPGYLPMNI